MDSEIAPQSDEAGEKIFYTASMTKAEVRTQPLKLPEPGTLPQWQEDLLDQRLEESEDDPGKPWKQVKAEIWPADR